MLRATAQLSLFEELPPAARLRKSSARTRYFFALWPDNAMRERLAAAAASIPPGSAARVWRVKPERYHLTLAFLGPLGAQQIASASKAGDAVRAAAFCLRLDIVGYFPNARVAWIGPQSPPPELLRLKAELDRELLLLGLPVERVAFRPHLTCLRGLDDLPDAPPPSIDWTIGEFVLVRSSIKPGASSYKVLRRWRVDCVAASRAASGA